MKAAGKLFIVAAKRTAFGKNGGALKDHTATDLAVVAAKAALQQINIKPEYVDHVVIGNAIQSSADGHYLARHVALKTGLPVEVPAVTINRLCGSGFQSVIDACHQILLGESNCVVTGGTENMSQCPFVVRNIRFGTTLGKKYVFEDSLWEGLTDTYCNMPMALTAEKLGGHYKLSRSDVDNFAYQSQCRWKAANDGGLFEDEITPVQLKTRHGEVIFAVDEHPRISEPQELANLKPVFKKDGLITAGNASGICDGAAAVVVASEQFVQAHSLKPLARIVGWSVAGCDPTVMGIGPVPAIRRLLKATNMELSKIDLVEVNEAFASQTVSVQRELKLDNERLNVNGGAIAVGHPLAASGSRIIGHLCYEMRRRRASFGLGSACIGGGQGIAVLLQWV